MTIDIRRDSIFVEKDGTISLSVHFFEIETGELLKTATAQGKTCAEIESVLMAKIKRIKKIYADKKQLEADADVSIDILRQELMK